MSGHGHVTPNADGSKARCGGPAICRECALEAARLHDAKALPMTPDIREKAERLAETIEAGDFIVVRRGKPWLNTLAVANIISQALLEAHNAGRGEAVKWLEDEAEASEGQAAYSILRAAATAIRSIT